MAGRRSEAMQALRSRLILRALSATTVSAAARELGLDQTTAAGWVKDSGLDLKTRTLTCPACGDRMERGELFFWRCGSCGAEWWPPEGSVPADPDGWAPRGVLLTSPEAVARIKRMHDRGATAEEIAEALNREGIPAAKGTGWTAKAVIKLMQRFGSENRHRVWMENKTRILSIISKMAGDGIDAARIARRLNAEGFRTATGREWNETRVYNFTSRYGIKIVRGDGRKGGGPATLEELAHFLRATAGRPS